MKANNIYQHQMLGRVFNFGRTHIDLFPQDSLAREVIPAIGAAAEKLGSYASQQVSDHGAIQKSGISHMDARKALKYKLDLIHQTAQVLKLDQFYMPRQKTDAAYIAAAESFAQLVQPHKKAFTKQGMPSDFVETLNAAVEDVKQTALAQNASKGDHSSSIADYQKTLKQALIDLKKFDALVKNTLSGNDGIMAAWRIARHVGRPGGKGTTAPVPAPTPAPESAPAEVAMAKTV